VASTKSEGRLRGAGGGAGREGVGGAHQARAHRAPFSTCSRQYQAGEAAAQARLRALNIKARRRRGASGKSRRHRRKPTLRGVSGAGITRGMTRAAGERRAASGGDISVGARRRGWLGAGIGVGIALIAPALHQRTINFRGRAQFLGGGEERREEK